MKIIKGDLIVLALNGHFDVIIHGCNCFNNMGKGIAKTIKYIFPEAYEVDQNTQKGEYSKLGDYTSAISRQTKDMLYVVNAYTQFNYSSRYSDQAVMVDYAAIQKVMSKIKEDFSGKRIGYPKIGAGLGGGDWDIISNIINKELEGEDHTLVLLED